MGSGTEHETETEPGSGIIVKLYPSEPKTIVEVLFLIAVHSFSILGRFPWFLSNKIMTFKSFDLF